MKSVHSTGLTNQKEEKEALTEEEEEEMWQAEQLGDQTARVLLNTIYFYNGKLFGIRAQEHRILRLSDIDLENGNTIVYRENCSKTFHGGIADMKKKARTAKHVCHESGKEKHNRCLFAIYKCYFTLVSSLRSKNDAFYFQPFETKFAFKNSPVGIHSLNQILPNLCMEIGTKRKTSHCLRVTCVSKLFQGSVEEKLIRGRSGHVSDALFGYEKTNKEQEIRVSKLLNPPVSKEKLPELKVNETSTMCDNDDDIVLPVFEIDEIDSLLNDYNAPEASASNIERPWNYASDGPINISGNCTVTINNYKM